MELTEGCIRLFCRKKLGRCLSFGSIKEELFCITKKTELSSVFLLYIFNSIILQILLLSQSSHIVNN